MVVTAPHLLPGSVLDDTDLPPLPPFWLENVVTNLDSRGRLVLARACRTMLADVHVHPSVQPELQLVLELGITRAHNAQTLLWAHQLGKDMELRLVAPTSKDDNKLRRALGHVLHDTAHAIRCTASSSTDSMMRTHLSSLLYSMAKSARQAIHACKIPRPPRQFCLSTVVAVTLDGRFRQEDSAFAGLVPDYLALVCPNMTTLNLVNFKIKQVQDKEPSKLRRLMSNHSSTSPAKPNPVPQLTTLRFTRSIIVDISAVMQQLEFMPNLDTMSLRDSCIHEVLWITQRQVVSQLTSLAFVGRSNAKRFMRTIADGDPFMGLRKLTLSCWLFGLEVGRVLMAAPQLTHLETDGIVSMEPTDNYRSAACTWQALRVDHLHMDVVCFLPLSPVKHLECTLLSLHLWCDGSAASNIEELQAGCKVIQACGGLKFGSIEASCKWKQGASHALWQLMPRLVKMLVDVATTKSRHAKLMCHLRGVTNQWLCWEVHEQHELNWDVEFGGLHFSDDRPAGEVYLHIS